MATAISHQWLLFELAGQVYGFDVNHVREIVSLRHLSIHRMPETIGFIEGVVTLRDEPIEIVEMRSAFGLHSLREETDSIQATLCAREQDHCNWIHELEACVTEERDFKLATDPHKCKFGQWYDKLRANSKELLALTNNDLATIDLFDKLDTPHQEIHAVAAQVMAFTRAAKPDKARQLVEDTRNTVLASLRKVFDKCREQIEIARRGLLFVLIVDGDVFGALVDRVAEVVQFSDEEIHRLEDTKMAKGLLYGVAKWARTDQMVQLLNVPELARWRLKATGKPADAIASPSSAAAPIVFSSQVIGGMPVGV